MKRIGVVGIPDGWSTKRLADAVEEATGFRCIIDLSKVKVCLESGQVRSNGTDLMKLDALFIKKVAPSYAADDLDRMELLRYVDAQGVPVFSSPNQIMRILDRLSCTVALRLNNIPMPPTVITEDAAAAAEAVENYGRAVLKPLFTSKARGMQIVERGRGASVLIKSFQAAGNKIIYVQKFIESNGKDLGVAFLGGEYLATYARVGDKVAWNTSTYFGGRYAPYEPSQEIIDLAYRAQEPFGLAFTCVDVAETTEGPMVFEVSAFGGFRGLLEANKIDAAAQVTDYVLRKISA